MIVKFNGMIFRHCPHLTGNPSHVKFINDHFLILNFIPLKNNTCVYFNPTYYKI